MYKKVIDGKPVIVKANSKNIPPLTEIRKVYAKIPDNKRIPIVFETKEQYLDEYIKNQEKAKGTKFPEWQKKQYKHQELQNMQNIVSRYTTNHNPFIDRRVVFFNDHKIPVKQFHDSALHEYGHELWEKNPRIRKDWKSVSRTSSPTSYGQTSKQEDFAESFMLAKTGRLQDPKRERILSDAITQNRALPAWHGNIERQTIQNPNYRKIAFTGNHAQISLMSIKPGQDIGLEKHDKVDQFFRIEQGKAQFILNKGLTKFSEGPSGAAMIPAGTWHNIKSVGKQPLKLYTIYSPPNHPAGTIQKDKPSHDDIEDPTIEIERWQREALLEQALNPTVDPTLTEPSSFEQAYSTTNTDFDQIYAKGMLGGGFDTAIKTIIPYSSTPEFKYKVLGETKTYNPEFETSDIGGKVNIIAGRRLGNPALADMLATSDVKVPTFGGQIRETPTKDRTSWNLAKVYHGTEKTKAWFIKKEGLKTAKELDADMGIKSEENISSMSEKTNPNLTYYFDKPHHALSWAKVVSDQSGGTPAVLEVDIPDKELQPDWNMPFGKPLSKKGGVPPEKITELDIKKIHYPKDDKDSRDMALVKKTTVPVIDYPESYNTVKSKLITKMSPEKVFDTLQDLYLEEAKEHDRPRQRVSREEFIEHLGGVSESRVKKDMERLQRDEDVPTGYIEVSRRDGKLSVGHDMLHGIEAARRLGHEEVPIVLVKGRGMTSRPNSFSGDWEYSPSEIKRREEIESQTTAKIEKTGDNTFRIHSEGPEEDWREVSTIDQIPNEFNPKGKEEDLE